MGVDYLLPVINACFVLGLAGVALLIAWRRRLPANFVGRVKADACLAMLRALLVLLAGLALAIGARVAGPPAFIGIGEWVAAALVTIGGLALAARVALYRLRIKPELEQLQGDEIRPGDPGESLPVPCPPRVGSR